MQSKHFFISLEGVEGVGKSTALTYIQDLLQQHHIQYCLTREPGGTDLAEQLRALLLQPREEEVTAATELLLMFASRSQNIERVIRPALARGEWVVADRFTDASFAYQGGGRGLPQDVLQCLADLVQVGLQPDITLLLDAPVEVGLQRLQQRQQRDRIELEQKSFFIRVRETYLALAKAHPNRFRIIEAVQSIEAVHQQIHLALQPYIEATLKV